MIIEKQNNWYRVADNFTKQIEGSIYEVVRVVNLDELAYVEWYLRVDIANVTKESFSKYGDYNEFLGQKSDMQKAVYLAVYGLEYDESQTCHNNNEITNILVEENIISKEETFEFML